MMFTGPFFFQMAYEREIIRVLTEAGNEGLSVAKITRHVFNASNTFFETVEFEDVYRDVTSWLQKNSKRADSILERVERGIYRLNPNSTLQPEFQFSKDEEPPMVKPQVDLSLSLFD